MLLIVHCEFQCFIVFDKLIQDFFSKQHKSNLEHEHVFSPSIKACFPNNQTFIPLRSFEHLYVFVVSFSNPSFPLGLFRNAALQMDLSFTPAERQEGFPMPPTQSLGNSSCTAAQPRRCKDEAMGQKKTPKGFLKVFKGFFKGCLRVLKGF